MSAYLKSNRNGFTLLEVIITMVVVAILGTIIYAFMGTAVTQSGLPVIGVKENLELAEVLEKITADYREALNSGGASFDLAAFVATVDSAAEVNALYGAAVDSVTIVSTAFDAGGNETGSDDNIKKVTLQQGDSRLTVLMVQ